MDKRQPAGNSARSSKVQTILLALRSRLTSSDFWWNFSTNPLVTSGAVVFGVLIGIYFPHFSSNLEPISHLFSSLLGMNALPIVFTGICTSIARLMATPNGKKILLTALYGVIIALGFTAFFDITVLYLFLHKDPLVWNHPAGEGAYLTGNSPSFSNFYTNAIPRNVFLSFYNADMLPIAFFSINFGLSLGLLTPINRSAIEFLEAFFNGLLKVFFWYMYIAPLGIFSAVAYGVSQTEKIDFTIAFQMIGFFTFFTLLQSAGAFAVMRYYSKKSLWEIFYSLQTSLSMTCFANPYLGMIPLMYTLRSDLGLNRKIVQLMVPLGVTLFHISYISYILILVIHIIKFTETPLDPITFFYLLSCSILFSLPDTGLQLLLMQVQKILSPLGLDTQSLTTVHFGAATLLDPFARLSNITGLTALIFMICHTGGHGDDKVTEEEEVKPEMEEPA